MAVQVEDKVVRIKNTKVRDQPALCLLLHIT